MEGSNGRPFLLAFQPGSELKLDPPRVVNDLGKQFESVRELVDGESYDISGGGIDVTELALPEVRPRWEAAVEACRRSGITDLAEGAWFVAAVTATTE